MRGPSAIKRGPLQSTATALTRMAATIPALTEVVAAVEAGGPVPADLRRRGIGKVEDVAPLVVYLASDASADVTGQYIGFGRVLAVLQLETTVCPIP